MFKKFKINLDESDYKRIEHYSSIGRKEYEKVERLFEEKLENFYRAENNDILDGSKLQEHFFPVLKNYDVFLSHSHDDIDNAKALAGFLYQKMKIRTFIDSNLWYYANNLLKLIDEKYCYNEYGETYNYNLRNFSTAHIHMILSNALTNMIDECECLLFLNSPNSNEKYNDFTENRTRSPWIYHEVNTVDIIRKNIPERHQRKKLVEDNDLIASTESFSQKRIDVSYNIHKQLSKFDNISLDELRYIANQAKSDKFEYLDEIYNINTSKSYRDRYHGGFISNVR